MDKDFSTAIKWDKLEIGTVLSDKKDMDCVIVKTGEDKAFVVRGGVKRECEVVHYQGKHISYYGVFEKDDNGDEGWIPLVTSAWSL